MSFNSQLSERVNQSQSNLCVGLDIAPENFPDAVVGLSELQDHCKKVIHATSEFAAAYKPNLAFFERWGSEGIRWLEDTLKLIPSNAIVIGDGKRGDIGNTATQYTKSLFEHFGFDAVTVNPFMGRDAIKPFLSDPGKGAFILCRTSNDSASDLQSSEVIQKTIDLSMEINELDNVGLVIGATAPEELKSIRDKAPEIPFLIPGVGAQGGDLESSLNNGTRNGLALINVSRGISFAGDLSEQAIHDAAGNYVKKMRDILNES
jgi:orotidine-5'-phosphate decarboxylase